MLCTILLEENHSRRRELLSVRTLCAVETFIHAAGTVSKQVNTDEESQNRFVMLSVHQVQILKRYTLG